MEALIYLLKCIPWYILTVMIWGFNKVNHWLFSTNLYVVFIAIIVFLTITSINNKIISRIKLPVLLLYIIFIIGCSFDWFPFSVNFSIDIYEKLILLYAIPSPIIDYLIYKRSFNDNK